MSWIIRALRERLAGKSKTLESLLEQGETYQAFTLANSIAQSTGREFGVEMSLNFPAGKGIPTDTSLLGTSNIGITVQKGRKKFTRVTAEAVQVHAVRIAEGVRFEPAGHGYEGFHIVTVRGRMTVLPGAIYIWLPIDKHVEAFLDWLFVNAYGLIPPAN